MAANTMSQLDSTAAAPKTSAELLPARLMAKLEQMELISRKIFRGRMKGERRSRRKGQSVEFADFRAYVPGDDLRFIDWNLFARLDRLFLKLFLEEEDLHLYLLIDNSMSMQFGDPSKLDVARRVAAALGFVALCRADRVQLGYLSQGVKGPVQAIRGRQSLWKLLRQLEGVDAVPEAPFVLGIRNFLQRCSGRGILILMSDLLEKSGFEPGLKQIIARDMDIYVIHILSTEELRPTLHGDLKLLDAEDQDFTEISMNHAILERYQQTVQAFLARARSFCHKHGIGYVFSSTELELEKLVQEHLTRRGLIR